MEYANNWFVWLVVIFLILIFICVWIRWTKSDEDGTRTSTSTRTSASSTMSRRVESMDTMEMVDDFGMPLVSERGVIIYEYDRPVDVVPEPQKKQSVGERRCQEVVERLFERKCRVQVRDLEALKNPDTNRKLELDLYIPELQIAIEYDGAQHQRVVPKFHPNGEADLKAQQRRDALKDVLCKRAGIDLIRVPHTVRLVDIEDHILSQLPDRLRPLLIKY